MAADAARRCAQAAARGEDRLHRARDIGRRGAGASRQARDGRCGDNAAAQAGAADRVIGARHLER